MGQLEPKTRELQAVVVVAANPATGVVFAYHVYQNAGQPLTVR